MLHKWNIGINYRNIRSNFYAPMIRIESGDVYPLVGTDAINNLQLFTQVGFPTLKSFEDARQSLSSVYYGGIGTPADRQLSHMIAEMESGSRAILTPTGQAAIAQVMCALLGSGDHALVVDSAAFSTKSFLCDNYLSNFGVEIEYYSPYITVIELKQKFKSSTKVIFLESPGSYTYDIQNLPAIVSLAREAGITTVFDNTWSASKFLKPLEWGIDIVVTSLGKYHFGISGISMGAIIVNDSALFYYLQSKSLSVGNRVSQLDCQMAVKSLDSLEHRLNWQQEIAYKVAEALLQVQEIETVIFPGLVSFPQHNDWKNLYSGVNSLLTVKLLDVLNDEYSTSLLNYLASLGAIAIGDSYGGSFSLVKKIDLKSCRTLTQRSVEGQFFRIYLGHESGSILVNQIKKAFQRTSKKFRMNDRRHSNLG
jgi:cystathionine beta-lyase